METTATIGGVDATRSLKRIEHIKAGVIDLTAGSLGKTLANNTDFAKNSMNKLNSSLTPGGIYLC